MRLLNTTQKIAGGFETKEFFDDALPDYAILSHTWGEEEVSYHDLRNGDYANMKGYAKIKKCCSIARSRNIAWVWIDTCCIDKASSAELTEAINSMYRWYQQAKVCYVFLEDVPARLFPESRWFTRGWTLQELIAPDTVVFLNRDWAEIGTRDTLQREISECTGIPLTILSGVDELGAFSVAQRMSWASRRQTSRIEDRAYSLLGIFGINMPLIYGEGIRAFIRLQEEIIRTLEDYTIFAWKDGNSHGGLLALSPDAFADSATFVRAYYPAFATKETWTLSNRGVQLRLPFMGIGPGKLGLAALNCTKAGKETQLLAIYLRDVTGTMERLERVLCDTLEAVDEDNLLLSRFPGRRICVAQPRQFLQSGSKPRHKDDSRCLVALRTIFPPEVSSSMGAEFFEKVAMRGQRMAKEGSMDGRSSPTGGYSELTYAAHTGDIEHMQFLLAHRHGVNTLDYASRTALSAAAAAGQTFAIWFLMCRPSIDVNAPASAYLTSDCMREDITALSIAALMGHEEVVWLLLSRGDINIYADPEETDERDPVIFAVAENHKNIVEMFLARDDFDVTREGLADEMVRVASTCGHGAMMRMLLGRVDLHDVKPAAAKYAARYGHEQIVKLLIARGVDINDRTPMSKSMIEIAAEYGQTAVVSVLLHRGVQFALAARALKKAAEAEHMDIVRLLVDSSHGKLLLRDVVELFLMLSGASPQIISAWHENALVLLSRGADRIEHPIDINRGIVPHIDMADGSGRTLLSWAAEDGQGKVVEALIRHGADITVKDNHGRTALDMAQDRGHYDVVEVLQRKRRRDSAKHLEKRSSGRSNKSKKRRQGQGSAS
jgi:ankyrin repeat protein